MKKILLHIIYIILLVHSLTGIAQNYSEFETELIKFHWTKDTLEVEDDLWIYDKSINEIKEVKLEIYKEPNVKTYLVDMIWYLGYHMNDVKCLLRSMLKQRNWNLLVKYGAMDLKQVFMII